MNRVKGGSIVNRAGAEGLTRNPFVVTTDPAAAEKMGMKSMAFVSARAPAFAFCAIQADPPPKQAGIDFAMEVKNTLRSIVAAAVFVPVVLVVALVVTLRAHWARIAVRVGGGWIAARSLLMLGWSTWARREGGDGTRPQDGRATPWTGSMIRHTPLG
jgi:hypothetical protein